MMRSSVNYVGKTSDYSDYVYYNADIINNETKDRAGGAAVRDPPIRFNETRDAPLIKDASQYHFSIIRFSMDGANRDLPLFIPNIQAGTGQTNVNLTSYAMAVTLQQTWNVTTGAGIVPVTFNITPTPRFIQYESETQNDELAPTPRPLADPRYRSQWLGATSYQTGDIVSMAIDATYNTGTAPYYVALKPSVGQSPLLTTGFWGYTDADLGSPQDLSSRYYWVYTYQHWVNLWNKTMYDPSRSGIAIAGLGIPQSCIEDLAFQFYNAWTAATVDAFPYATVGDFVNGATSAFAPQMVYTPSTRKFQIYADADGYGKRTNAFTPAAPGVAGATTPPRMRLFFNNNMYNLFANYDNIYYNVTSPTSSKNPFFGLPIYIDPTLNTGAYPASGIGLPLPIGYTNEILFTNKFWQNVADYRLSPYSGVPPLGYVTPNGATSTPNQQRVYWIADQDYPSTDTLWSPISSIVFTSTLMPVKSEYTGQPIVLGSGNAGINSDTTQNAFQPIITDISLPLANGAEDYRGFITYLPAAEYRLSDFTSSHQPIQNIDVQVYWKNRLDNQLYPITMANLSSVSIKMMFRHKDAMVGGKESV